LQPDSARHTAADRMAAHRKSDQRRDDLCGIGLRRVCHSFDLRSVGHIHRRGKLDNFRFEFLLAFLLSHEFQDTFVNKVLNGSAGSIRQFSEFSHHSLIEFV
jgi:hypothetical protein